MPSILLPRLAALCAVLLLPTFSHAQAVVATESEKSGGAVTNAVDGAAGTVPLQKGFNFSLLTTSQHDSSNGWSSLVNPSGAYRLSKNFSADVSIPLYDYIVVETTNTTTRKVSTDYATKHFVAGDTVLNAHAQFSPSLFGYEFTATLGLPSGNNSYGLGAGQVTYQFNNTFQQSFSIFTPTVSVGIGDSSSLSQERVRKSYTTVGTEGVFQAGTSVDLPHDLNFSASAYENLPIASQTLYSTTGRGKKKITTATGKSVAEDNGFETSLDIPLSTHVTLSGFYNRSLRSHIDTVGFSFLFLLKGYPRNSVH